MGSYLGGWIITKNTFSPKSDRNIGSYDLVLSRQCSVHDG